MTENHSNHCEIYLLKDKRLFSIFIKMISINWKCNKKKGWSWPGISI